MSRMSKIIEIKIPYLPEIGKNKMKGFRRGGGYYTNQSYKDACSTLSTLIRAKLKEPFNQDKVWVEIFLQKPRTNCDVANLIDGICDSIKQAIEVDDKWFSLKADWEYDKNVKPYLVITIIQ